MDIEIKKRQDKEKLLQSVNLKDGWDGENGRAPYKQDVDNAIKFMDHIPSHGLASSRVYIAGDGEVGFDWREIGLCLEITFNDNDISFFAEINGVEYGSYMNFNDGFPVELKALMDVCFSRNQVK